MMDQTPAFTSHRDTRDGFSVVVEVANLDSEPCLRVKDESLGEEIVIPIRFLHILTDPSSQLVKTIAYQKSIAQQVVNDPELKFGLEKIGSGGGFRYLKGTDPTIEATPVLAWIPDEYHGRGSSGILNPRRESDIYGTKVAGWNLTLTGVAMDVSLGFAQWDDETGVASLVANMADLEFLAISLALLFPKEAALLSARQNLLALSNSKSIPPLLVQSVKEFLQKNNLCGKGDGIISLVGVSISGQSIPVAIGVQRPSVPNFAEELIIIERARLQALAIDEWRHDILLEELKVQTRIEWEVRFRQDIEWSKWRLVDLPYAYNKKGLEVLWITSLAPAAWSSIEAMAKQIAMTWDWSEFQRGKNF